MFIRMERSIDEFFKLYPVVSVIVVINLVLWLLTGFLSLDIGREIYLWGVGFNPAVQAGEYWRIITPIFLHGGFAHVAFNSFSLILFGPALERMIGKPMFIVAYLAMGIAGNLGTYFWDINSLVPHLGASTSIYGLFGVYIYMRIFRKDLIDRQSAQLVTTITIIGVVMTFIGPNISITGHLFGFLGGLCIAPFILLRAQPFYLTARPRRRAAGNGETSFDPNRWNKKRLLPAKVRKNLFWIILAILVVIGFLSNYL